MPHHGLSLFRLKEHFRKSWGIYFIGCVVCALFSNILFTATAPQTPIAQEVLIYLADGYTSSESLDPVAEELLAYGQTVDETLLEVCFENLAFGDPNTDTYGPMILASRLALGEGDAFIASSHATESLLANEVYYPLDELLAEGWLEGLDLETVTHTSVETGETSIAALRLDNVPAIAELGAINNQGATLMVMWNSTNLDTTLEVVEHMIREMMEGTYNAPAEADQPAA